MPIDYDDQAEINRIATNFVEKELIAHDWEMFKITPDYRIDYDIEPRKDKSLTGHRFAVRQKGKREVDLSTDVGIACVLKVDHVC